MFTIINSSEPAFDNNVFQKKRKHLRMRMIMEAITYSPSLAYNRTINKTIWNLTSYKPAGA